MNYKDRYLNKIEDYDDQRKAIQETLKPSNYNNDVNSKFIRNTKNNNIENHNNSESLKSVKNFINPLDLQPDYIKQIINRKNYFIKNKSPNRRNDSIISDPKDIDDLDSTIKLFSPYNNKNNNNNNNINNSKLLNNIYSKNTKLDNIENNISDLNYNPNKQDVTDEIDFAYNHIYKFEHENEINDVSSKHFDLIKNENLIFNNDSFIQKTKQVG